MYLEFIVYFVAACWVITLVINSYGILRSFRAWKDGLLSRSDFVVFSLNSFGLILVQTLLLLIVFALNHGVVGCD